MLLVSVVYTIHGFFNDIVRLSFHSTSIESIVTCQCGTNSLSWKKSLEDCTNDINQRIRAGLVIQLKHIYI